jgi:hypothetical protein
MSKGVTFDQFRYRVMPALLLMMVVLILSGCGGGPTYIAPEAQKQIDRSIVEFPSGLVLKTAVTGITSGAAIAFVKDEGPYKDSMLIAEAGVDDRAPRIYGWKADRTWFSVYPRRTTLPFSLLGPSDKIYGPIGGMVVYQNKIYVTHKDAHGRGAVSCFNFDGSRTTVVGDLPAEGEYSVTDIAVHPTTGRLWFGLGSATNSGVVGLDDWLIGWVRNHPYFCDLPAVNLRILGLRFSSKNPIAGLFGGDDNVATAPFHPFGKRNLLRIPAAANDRPTSAIFSISPTGGDLRVEAHGVRMPRGLAFDEFANPWATNNGMELRGSRPVKDDPDALLKVIQQTWYGFPDFSADLYPISDPRFQPSPEVMSRTDYPELSFLIDHSASDLRSPEAFRDNLLFGAFPSQSGAAKFDFVPGAAPKGFGPFRGNAIVALWGDRAPFGTGGQPLRQTLGYRVARVDLVNRKIDDFIHNTRGIPASRIGRNVEALERPVDAKFGPGGKLYILDYGQVEMRNGREKINAGTSRVLVLEPIESPQSPTTRE